MAERFLCNFAMVDAVMAALHEIEESQRSAFSNRIKHMQRLGYPSGTNTGRGRAAAYSAHQLYLIGFALELAQLGLTTDSAIPLMQDNFSTVATATSAAIRSRYDLQLPCIFIYFDPARLDPLMESTGGGMTSIRGKFRYGTREFGDVLLAGSGAERRFTVIAVNKIIEDIEAAIRSFESPDAGSAEFFVEDLMTWSERYRD